MPGHPELGGDGRDSGAVDHQPPQHISGTAARRGRPRGCQRAQVLVEHRTATLWGQTAVTGHGHPQHQRIAGDRQIGQRPGHGVAVSAFGTAVRAPRIPGHRTAEDRRLLLVDGSVGDRHTQLDGAHDRVGNNGWRAGSSLRHGSPRWRGWSSLGTRIVTHRGPASAQRHDPTARYPPTTSALSFTKSRFRASSSTSGLGQPLSDGLATIPARPTRVQQYVWRST